MNNLVVAIEGMHDPYDANTLYRVCQMLFERCYWVLRALGRDRFRGREHTHEHEAPRGSLEEGPGGLVVGRCRGIQQNNRFRNLDCLDLWDKRDAC